MTPPQHSQPQHRQPHSSRPAHSAQSPNSLSRQLLHEAKQEAKKISCSRSPHSIVILPKKTRFETQETHEEIIVLVRKHIITNVSWVFWIIFLSTIPFLMPLLPFFNMLPEKFQFMTILMWYIMILIFALENFLTWYFNVNIVTDERIVDVDFFSLIYKSISEAKLNQIQDVTYKQGGFLESIFDYGTINIQTAAEVPEVEFQSVPKPAAIAKVINQLITQEEQEQYEGRVR